MAKRTLDDIKAIAGNFEYLTDFRNHDQAAYTYAKRHGWLEGLGLKDKIADRGTYTYEYCRELSLSCKTRCEFHDKNKTAYRYSLKNGWLDTFTWLRKPSPKRQRGYWTIERTRHALLQSYGIRDLRRRFGGAEKAAKKYGILHLLKRNELGNH